MKTKTDRTKWFEEARFGMFIHWGLYAIPARGEWAMSMEKMSNEQYRQYFEQFHPKDYDPAEWARLAKQAGMKYAVMTAKHHDGFCLFDSALTDYKSTNTPAGRDLIREYVDAFRSEGIKVGLYYSLLDWHHPDYPAYGDENHPMRDNEAYKDKEQDFSRYVEYLHGQVRELLSNYGKIDVMWFDFSYDNMSGEKWEATRLVNMVRELQPEILIDDRLAWGILAAEPVSYAGDFFSPEMIIPPSVVVNDAGERVPWETCATASGSWGYYNKSHDFPTAQQQIRALVECVSKNGNLLLNVSPDANGRIAPETKDVLQKIGAWMDINGDSIYGCGSSELPKPEWGRLTQKGNRLFAHIYDRGIGPVNLRNMYGKVKRATMLLDGSEVDIATPWNAVWFKNDLFLNLVGRRLPDENDTVVELELIENGLEKA